jgi:hypothetical protein
MTLDRIVIVAVIAALLIALFMRAQSGEPPSGSHRSLRVYPIESPG